MFFQCLDKIRDIHQHYHEHKPFRRSNLSNNHDHKKFRHHSHESAEREVTRMRSCGYDQDGRLVSKFTIAS